MMKSKNYLISMEHSISEYGLHAIDAPFYITSPTVQHKEYAEAIAQWTQLGYVMLPKTKEDILDLFAKRHSVVITDVHGRPISHAAITYEYADGTIEIGSVITNPNPMYRKRGFGTRAIYEIAKKAKQLYPDRKIIAMCNESSLPLFLRLGGTIIPESELTPEAFSYCHMCPRFHIRRTGRMCCDTGVDMSHIQ